MSFASNDGVRIRYETEGEGEPLVLVDGFSTSLEMWREQRHCAALAESHQLVLIDVRGHGQSDKPHILAQYGPDQLVGDVLAVLRDLGHSSAHYLGASMGAAIGFEIARRAPDRLRSLTLLGYGRYGPPTDAQRQFQAMGRMLEETAVKMGAEAAWAALEQMAGSRPAEERTRFLENDHRALLALLEAMDEWPGLEEFLPTCATPTLFLVTEGDPFHAQAKLCAEVMPRGTFVSLPGGAHGQGSYGPEIIAPHVTRFLAEVEGIV